jgi:hypothetical protein
MRVWFVLLATGLISGVHPGSAFGQSSWRLDGYGGIIPSVSTGLVDLDDASENAATFLGISVQRSLGGSGFAVEGDLQVVPGFLKGRGSESLVTRSRLIIFSSSVIARPPWSRRLQPYASLGLSSVHLAFSDRLAALDQRSRFVGVVAGAGTLFRVLPPVSVRCDLRYLRTQRSAPQGLFEDAFIDFVHVRIGAGVEW